MVSGVAGGVGARTLALALGVGINPPGQHSACDVLVCRGTVHSVGLAERHVATVRRPVLLAVVVDGQGLPFAARAKLKMIAPHVAGMIKVPWVPRWREITDPYAEAARLASSTADEVPKHLRAYHATVMQLAHHLAATLSPAVTAAPAPALGAAPLSPAAPPARPPSHPFRTTAGGH
ncbi:hypothetical protein DI005_20205 [Prauserella sp. PE36]|nr:hypothetical protein DI005_20205 [Prauserella sp. PE36]